MPRRIPPRRLSAHSAELERVDPAARANLGRHRALRRSAAIPDPTLLLSPLISQEAVLSSSIEGNAM
jgi:hypothetical protein